MSSTAAQRAQIAVVGAATCDEPLARLAFQVGRGLARRGALMLCGGRGGVMEHAAAGAKSEGGATVGILPGASAAESRPNSHLDLALFTGLGQGRNLVLVLASSAVIAVGGGWGTLSEIALALKHQIPVVILESWSLERPDGHIEPLLQRADSPQQAVEMALTQRGSS